MFFDWLRKRLKWMIIVIAVAFAVGLLYVGVPLLGGRTTNAAAVVAKVNGTDITYQEHQAAFENLRYQYMMYLGSLSAADEEFLRYQALEMLLNTKLALEAARKEGITVSKSEIDAALAELKQSFSSEDAYREALRRSGMTENDLRNVIAEDLLLEKALEKRQAEIQITDEEVAEAYEAVNARHILIRPEENEAGELDWDAALAEANEILAQLRAGADFAVLAAAHSDDGTADQGGELGFFTRGMMVPEFEEAAFALEEGEISEPVRTQYGYHIIQVLERRRAEGEEFENAKESIRQSLQQQRLQQALNEWIGGLRSTAKVEILDPVLNAVTLVVNGQYAQAIGYYEKAIEQQPNDGYLNYSLGNVYQLLGDAERAIEQFRAATQKQPFDPELHYALALALLGQDRKEEAVPSLMKAAELSPNDYMMLIQIQSTLTNLGYTEEAATVQGYIDDLLNRYQQQLQAPQQEGETDGAAEDEPAAADAADAGAAADAGEATE